MELELKAPNKLLSLEVLLLLVVVHVISFDQESLRLFKEILDGDTFHEVWVQVVVNTFGASDPMLHRPGSLLFKLIQNDEGIGLGKGVQVRQV